MPPVDGELVRLQRAVLHVDAAAHPLHVTHESLMTTCIDVDVAERVGDSRGRWRDKHNAIAHRCDIAIQCFQHELSSALLFGTPLGKSSSPYLRSPFRGGSVVRHHVHELRLQETCRKPRGPQDRWLWSRPRTKKPFRWNTLNRQIPRDRVGQLTVCRLSSTAALNVKLHVVHNYVSSGFAHFPPLA